MNETVDCQTLIQSTNQLSIENDSTTYMKQSTLDPYKLKIGEIGKPYVYYYYQSRLQNMAGAGLTIRFTIFDKDYKQNQNGNRDMVFVV